MVGLVERFEREGWVLVEGVASVPEVATLRSGVAAEMDRQGQTVTVDVLLTSDALFDLFCADRLVSVLRELLGDRFLAVPHSSVAKNSFGHFHTDTTSAELEGRTFHRRPDYRMVTVVIYLQDNTDEFGGGIRFVPGSHRTPDRFIQMQQQKERAREALKQSTLKRFARRLSGGRLFDYTRPFWASPGEMKVPSKAGDAVIWDMRLAHSASHPGVKGRPPYGDKLAIFYTCGRNSVATEAYLAYVSALAQNEYLRRPRSVDVRRQEVATRLGFVIR